MAHQLASILNDANDPDASSYDDIQKYWFQGSHVMQCFSENNNNEMLLGYRLQPYGSGLPTGLASSSSSSGPVQLPSLASLVSITHTAPSSPLPTTERKPCGYPLVLQTGEIPSYSSYPKPTLPLTPTSIAEVDAAASASASASANTLTATPTVTSTSMTMATTITTTATTATTTLSASATLPVPVPISASGLPPATASAPALSSPTSSDNANNYDNLPKETGWCCDYSVLNNSGVEDGDIRIELASSEWADPIAMEGFLVTTTVYTLRVFLNEAQYHGLVKYSEDGKLFFNVRLVAAESKKEIPNIDDQEVLVFKGKRKAKKKPDANGASDTSSEEKAQFLDHPVAGKLFEIEFDDRAPQNYKYIGRIKLNVKICSFNCKKTRFRLGVRIGYLSQEQQQVAGQEEDVADNFKTLCEFFSMPFLSKSKKDDYIRRRRDKQLKERELREKEAAEQLERLQQHEVAMVNQIENGVPISCTSNGEQRPKKRSRRQTPAASQATATATTATTTTTSSSSIPPPQPILTPISHTIIAAAPAVKLEQTQMQSAKSTVTTATIAKAATANPKPARPSTTTTTTTATTATTASSTAINLVKVPTATTPIL